MTSNSTISPFFLNKIWQIWFRCLIFDTVTDTCSLVFWVFFIRLFAFSSLVTETDGEIDDSDDEMEVDLLQVS